MVVPIQSASLQFLYGGELIKLNRLVRNSASQKMLIKVHPDCRVEVYAAADKSNKEVIEAAKKRARWIHKQLEAFRSASEYYSPRQFVSGESHYYLGKQHLLKVIESPVLNGSVKLLRGKLEATVSDKNDKQNIEELINDWYRQRAKLLFKERLNIMLQQTLWVDSLPQISIRLMQKQWGSCSTKGRLTLNLHLIKTPIQCIDYVILHELCHIAEHNHSARFYRLISQVMPNWMDVKVRLDGMAAKAIS